MADEATSHGENQEQQQQPQEPVVVNPDLPLATTHPLHHVWVLWYDNPGAGKRVSQDRWFSHMKKIAQFSSVEDFWGIFNNIRPPSRLTCGSNYHLFKRGIQPMWEDSYNESGGKWTFTIPKKLRESVDDIWLSLILAVIGENFDEGEDICGAVASVRKAENRIAIWTRKWADERGCLSIGHQMKQFLELSPQQSISYIAHVDAAKRQTSYSKNRYEL